MKLLSVILSLLYFFTAQLSVHAFTMHWSLHWEWRWGAEHHHEDKKPGCWHPQPTHDHSDHADNTQHQENHDDHWDHDMSMCLDQSMWAFVISDIDIQDLSLALVQPIRNDIKITSSIHDQYFYSLHDPWRWEDWVFSKFLKNDLYGHWVIMHC